MPSPIEAALRHRWSVLVLTLARRGLRRLVVRASEDRRLSRHLRADGADHHAPIPAARRKRSSGRSPSRSRSRWATCRRSRSIRSRTIFGLSVVQLIFEEGVDGYWARQRVQEKLGGIDLPEGAKPELARWRPPTAKSTATSCSPTASHDLMELRTLNDWVVIPRLLRVAGRGRRVQLRRLRQAIHGHAPAGAARALRPDARRRGRRAPDEQRRRRRQRPARAAACRS